ncbi:hypothetical protein IEQ34_016365 [Dendrobium chrysotoxum]|uniref:Uncharacterized protein n=1 Tax=Dendrobium chrysotoxum TaxID=161865 RepID=A0AAV7GD97_DENCH|nr:hypothetical protein IEQ34_016365 [Dendrobium chrysotoxum]
MPSIDGKLLWNGSSLGSLEFSPPAALTDRFWLGEGSYIEISQQHVLEISKNLIKLCNTGKA